MKLLLFVPDVVLWALIQMPLLALMMISRAIYRLMSAGYYLVAKIRRWVKSEASWQEHDRLLGHMDPKEIERIEAEKAQAQVYRNELADHARGCDQCWAMFVSHHYFMDDTNAEGCDIGRMLRKRANDVFSIAA